MVPNRGWTFAFIYLVCSSVLVECSQTTDDMYAAPPKTVGESSKESFSSPSSPASGEGEGSFYSRQASSGVSSSSELGGSSGSAGDTLANHIASMGSSTEEFWSAGAGVLGGILAVYRAKTTWKNYQVEQEKAGNRVITFTVQVHTVKGDRQWQSTAISVDISEALSALNTPQSGAIERVVTKVKKEVGRMYPALSAFDIKGDTLVLVAEKFGSPLQDRDVRRVRANQLVDGGVYGLVTWKPCVFLGWVKDGLCVDRPRGDRCPEEGDYAKFYSDVSERELCQPRKDLFLDTDEFLVPEQERQFHTMLSIKREPYQWCQRSYQVTDLKKGFGCNLAVTIPPWNRAKDCETSVLNARYFVLDYRPGISPVRDAECDDLLDGQI